MKCWMATRWIAVGLCLAAIGAAGPGTASAQEEDTVTVTGTFKMDELWGTVGSDLAGVFASGADHTWTLTVTGVTHAHAAYQSGGIVFQRNTWLFATSVDLQFSGPAAATLNAIFAELMDPTEMFFSLSQYFNSDGAPSMNAWGVAVSTVDGVVFQSYSDELPESFNPPFPIDADGYPLLPSQLVASYTEIGDHRSGAGGTILSIYDTLECAGGFGEHEPPPPPPPPVPATISITDVSVPEGNRGSSKMHLTVRVSGTITQAITVDFRTVNGTAVAKSDYTAKSGTLTFQPGHAAQSIMITIKVDRKVEADETFTVELFNAVGATITDGVATATIRNDD